MFHAVFHFDTPSYRRDTVPLYRLDTIEKELKAISVCTRGTFMEGMEFAFSTSDCETVRDLARSSKEMNMQWTTPAFTDLRFGFEITMYIATR
ncbi:coenzyme PQQ synthesis protein A (plasmid) [Caballeronia cordobensis]|nr:coenzyme PQQ synthesis protein A [Burkholderia sp. RPE67]